MDRSWKKYTHLHKKKKRRDAGECIVEGVRLCREALLSGWEIEIAYVSTSFTHSEHWPQFQDFFRRRKFAWRVIQTRHFKRMSDTESPQGVLMVLRQPHYNLEKLNLRQASFIVLLQGIRDPGNLGTIIRTADWYGADALILSDECVDPFNSKVLRGTMGSIFHFPVYATEKLADEIQKLKQYHFRVVASDVYEGQVLQDTRFKKPIALILGGEAQGISAELKKLADLSVRIRRYGQAESLNVAIAGGILMNHISTQISRG